MKRYKSASAFRTALEDRLRRRARASGINPQRLWTVVAFDRLLARLLGGKGSRFVLKGGYAMELRIKNARTTKDIDLTVLDFKAADAGIKGILVEPQTRAARDLGDFFSFTIGNPIMDLDAAPYGGGRFPVEATMDGRPFVGFHLDVGLGDVNTGPVEEIKGQDWFDFAGIPRPRFRAISREQQFAEKIHAYTLPRGGRRNSRVKDLVDRLLLVELGGMDRGVLTQALKATFDRRATHSLPHSLPEPPADWAKPFAALAQECGFKHDLPGAMAAVTDFLGSR
jgi:hypothetical protein